MATVYLAHDVRHDRPVALKVLHPDLAHSLGPERFQREIRLLARLQHPHILTVHDSGDAAGQLWFTMPFIEGESLRQRLNREKQLPVDEAVRIAREAAQALEYAHQHGVVHRDIKPENLLLTQDGNTLVADFGIARTLTAGAERLTETGLAIGTPAYMSPEQASGEHDVGPRTDIYSLGAVLYEMLAGEPPFTGPTPQAVIAKRFSGEAPSVHRTRPTIPDALDHAVGRALALVPADRFATAADLARALAAGAATTVSPGLPVPPVASGGASRRRMPVALITLLLGFAVGLGLLFAWRRGHGGETASGPRLVAVLPFENVGAPADDYFADGMTDAVRGKLTSLPGLQVTSSASSAEFRHSTRAPREIARALGVNYLLVGKVRWEKHPDGTSRVQVSPELIDAASGASRWQQPFDANLTDVFQVQADIAGRVAGALDVALGDSAKRQLAERPTASLAAYDAYLRGMETANGVRGNDPPSLRVSATALEQAVALDPAFGDAWAQLSRTYALLNVNGAPSPELGRRARIAADRAIAVAPASAAGYFSLARYFQLVKRESDSAQAALQAGLRLNPADPEALSASATLLRARGQWDSAEVQLQRAADLDPRSAIRLSQLADNEIRLHRLPEARASAERAMQLAPGNVQIIQTRITVELAAGDLPAAQAIYRRAAAASAANAAALPAYMAGWNELYWVLPDADQQVVLRLGPSAFDDDRLTWALSLAEIESLRGDQARMRVYADSARLAALDELKSAPDDGQLHCLYGVVLAYLGRKAEAIAEGQRGVALWPISRDAVNGPYMAHQLVRIYLLTGERERALDGIEALLTPRYYVTPGRLRIDPTFASLKGDPRFERLASGGN